MTDLPAEAITAAAGAIWDEHISGRDLGDTGQWCNALARAALEAAAPRLVAQAIVDERARLADVIETMAGNYPEDVFPPDGTTTDAISAKAMRHAYRNAARAIRDLDPAEPIGADAQETP